MLQMENINKIEYLKKVIEELKAYPISLEKESQKLDLLISNYKLKKEKEESVSLNLYGNPETELSVELMKLEMDLEIYILFLELIHLTENWDLNVNLEKFDMIENKTEKLILTFGNMDLQKEIYKRFHNLLLKKIIQDYQEEKEEYINYYQDLKKFPYLIESIQSYGKANHLSLPEHLENYTLDTILEDYFILSKQDLISIEENETKVETTEEKSSIHTSLWKKAKQIQYQLTPLSYLGKAKVEVIQRIGLERAKFKTFKDQDLSGIDLSTVNFIDVNVENCNLKNTGAHIDPQKVRNKSLYYCNLEGLDLSNVDFNEVEMRGVNLKNTNAYINPQTVKQKNLYHTNLENLDLSEQDFSNCTIFEANLKGTNAHIDPQKISFRSLKGCNLEGLDLSGADFTDVYILRANLAETNAFIDLNKIAYGYEETLEDITKKGNLSGCRVILSDPYTNEKFDLTNAMILNESSIEKMIK